MRRRPDASALRGPGDGSLKNAIVSAGRLQIFRLKSLAARNISFREANRARARFVIDR